ncbi:MAG: cobalamin-binding protein [Pseudomonadota bacterium]
MRTCSVAVWSLLLWGCGSDSGNVTNPQVRLISLAPHITELVFTAGAGDSLVGVVEYSDFPEAAKSIPRIGDAFQIDLERIVALKPDFVLAWKSGNPEHSLSKLRDLGLTVVSFEPDSFESIASELRRIGEITGSEERANDAADDFLNDLASLRAEYAGKTPVRVFYQISAQPIFTVNGNHVISDAIELCGGENIFDDLEVLAPSVDLEAILVRDPELIVFGVSFADQAKLQWGRLEDLSASRLGGLREIPGEHLSRASTRMLSGVRQLCEFVEETRTARDSNAG